MATLQHQILELFYFCLYNRDQTEKHVYIFSLPTSAIHCPRSNIIRVHVAFKRKHLESNIFSKDNVSNVNTKSNPDHIYSGLASTLHFHDTTLHC